MKNMKKLIAMLVLSSTALVGCGGPSEEELAERRLEMEHQQKMAEIQAQVDIARLQSSQSNDPEYSQAVEEYNQAGARAYQQSYESEMHQMYQQDTSGDLTTGLLGGAIVGYMASELLDNGWSRGYDSYGRETFYDRDHRSVSRSDYMNQSKTSNVSKSIPKKSLDSKLTRFKRKSQVLTEKAKRKAVAAKDKALTKAKPALQKAKEKSKVALQKSKELTKKGIQKASPVVKKGWDTTKSKAKDLKKKATPAVKKGWEKTKQKASQAKSKSKPLFQKAKSKASSSWKKTKSSFSSKRRK